MIKKQYFIIILILVFFGFYLVDVTRITQKGPDVIVNNEQLVFNSKDYGLKPSFTLQYPDSWYFEGPSSNDRISLTNFYSQTTADKKLEARIVNYANENSESEYIKLMLDNNGDGFSFAANTTQGFGFEIRVYGTSTKSKQTLDEIVKSLKIE